MSGARKEGEGWVGSVLLKCGIRFMMLPEAIRLWIFLSI
jgi:hypothetical protein